MRSGDVGDEAGRSAADAGPLDLDAVRADDDLIEALAAGLVPPPSGPRDTSDVEGELVALLAGWVADVRPETLLHRPEPLTVGAPVPSAPEVDPPSAPEIAGHTAEDADEERAPVWSGPPLLLEHDEVTRPVALAAWRSSAARPYLLRAAAALVTVALVGSGVVARSYEAHPGDSLWVVAQMVFPAKSHSVEAAISVSTALNTARVALERGRLDEARQAFQTVAAKLADVDEADGRAELNQQMDYVNAQLATAPAATDAQAAAPKAAERPLATGTAGAVIPSSPAVTPGATAALATTAPSTPSAPAVLAAAPPAPDVTSGGSPAADGTSSSPGVVAAPAPPVDTGPVAPVASAPPADPQPSSPPPAVTDPGSTVSTTTAQPVPTTDPPTSPPTSEPATPTQAPVDSTTTDPGYPASNNSPAAVAPDSTTTGAQSSADTSSATVAAADVNVNIDTSGTVGSTLGQVTGVVTNTAGS